MSQAPNAIQEVTSGLYDMPREQYDAIEAINMSCLLEGIGGGTMAHVRYALDNERKGTQAQLDGIARHEACFEPEKFEAIYVQRPDGLDLRTKDGKAFKAECEASGKTLLGVEVWASCIAIRDNCRENPWLRTRLEAPGSNEVAVIWRDPTSEVLCKGRLDRRYVLGDESGILDLKTLSNDYAGSEPFAKHVANYRDHIKAAWYLDALDALSPCDRSFTWIAAEGSAPYMIALYQPDPDMLDEARRAYRSLLTRYAKCVESGIWPGYESDPQTLSLPKWAYFHRSAPQ